MSSKKIVVSLGGNALGYEPADQIEKVEKVADIIADLIDEGYEIIITHGNGPQVGLVNNAFEYASNNNQVPMMPFAECGALTQGYIGYHLQQTITNNLRKRKIDKKCITILTQVLVDKSDDAFKNPTKPIGTFYDKDTADKLIKETGYTYVEDAGRGYRRVVASPMPIDIIEKDSIDEASKDNIVICCGGGGIPVIEEDGSLKGVAAVIDKDRTSSLIADLLDADILLILTAVNNVYLNFNEDNEIMLTDVSSDEIRQYIAEGHFAKGSMLPKVEACLAYLKDDKREAIITSLENGSKCLKDNSGTHIRNK